LEGIFGRSTQVTNQMGPEKKANGKENAIATAKQRTDSIKRKQKNRIGKLGKNKAKAQTWGKSRSHQNRIERI